jgi:Flp pilus assembly protein TadG
MATGHSRRGPNGRPKHRTRGQTLVEFALVIPIFILVLSGILDFGFMLFSRMTVINAARDGARAAIVLQDRSLPSIQSAVLGQVQGSASGGGIGTSSLVVGEQCLVAGSSSKGTCGAANTKQGDSILVTVDYPYHSFFPFLAGTVINLSASVQMVFE